MKRIVEISSDALRQCPVPETIVRQMYDLLGSNMTRIIGDSNPDWQAPAEFEKWKREVFLEGLQKGTRHILLLDTDGLRGFISYTVPDQGKEIYFNEFQLRPSAQRDGVTFKRLLLHFLDQIEELSHDSIRTYSNNKNRQAQSLIERIGFHTESQAERGIRYSISKHDLKKRFQKNRSEDRTSRCTCSAYACGVQRLTANVR